MAALNSDSTPGTSDAAAAEPEGCCFHFAPCPVTFALRSRCFHFVNVKGLVFWGAQAEDDVPQRDEMNTVAGPERASEGEQHEHGEEEAPVEDDVVSIPGDSLAAGSVDVD